jgi:hypothetical protein
MRVFVPFLCAVVLGLPPQPGAAQPYPATPMRVISDTPEFCARLARHFALVQQGPVAIAAERVMLADEGVRMCAQGQIRAGIERLRMALFPYQRRK